MSIFSEIVEWCEKREWSFRLECRLNSESMTPLEAIAYDPKIKFIKCKVFNKCYETNTPHTRKLLAKAWRKFVKQYKEKDNG